MGMVDSPLRPVLYDAGIMPTPPTYHGSAAKATAAPGRLCCTKPLVSEVPLSPDGFILRFL